MLCDICKKNEATIHIKEIHNGKITTSNLCGECAKNKEEKGEFASIGFNLAEILFNLGKLQSQFQSKGNSASDFAESITCPSCGWTLEQFRNNHGRLGCPECYQTFAPMISEALTGFQRGAVHLGKRPPNRGSVSTVALEFELKQQQRQLEEHVRREEYEAAAVCRDRISALKLELEECQKKNADAATDEKLEKKIENE